MKKKVSLVLSGGGARGIAHIGVIEELESQGFEIFSISGTSMGALVGGVYASGRMEDFKKWLFNLDKIKIFNLIDFALSSQGFLKGDKLLKKLTDFIPEANIENLKIAYTAVATDIINKKEVAFTSGNLYNAIRASISIPTVFTPVKTKTALLVDGGVLNNIPINHAKRIFDDILIVVDVNADVPVIKFDIKGKDKISKQSVYKDKIKEFYSHFNNNTSEKVNKIGYFELITKTINLMTNQMSQISIEKYSPDILINISHDTCNMYDFLMAEELVEIGKYTTRKSIAEFKKSCDNI
jgi:NTE family protein